MSVYFVSSSYNHNNMSVYFVSSSYNHNNMSVYLGVIGQRLLLIDSLVVRGNISLFDILLFARRFQSLAVGRNESGQSNAELPTYEHQNEDFFN